MATLNGNEILSTASKKTQVYLATHKGEDYLSFMHRSFISFSYDGKNIEDFNLIATVSNDRWEHRGYADFEDFTTTYDIVNGQFYWATSFRTNRFDFQLSTDSITQQQLDEFLRLFKPGEAHELILAEHPNRAILARVAEVPEISMIPFELKKEIKLNEQTYTVHTTEYKGSITLSFITDDPFWYAKINVFGSFNAVVAQENWVDANGNLILDHLDQNPDVLKIVMEDGIPINIMIKDTMALGGDIYAMVEVELRSCLAIEVTESVYLSHNGGEPRTWYHKINDNGTIKYYKGAHIVSAGETEEEYSGIIGGAQISSYGSITRLDNYEASYDNETYFYYSGTAPAPITIEFKLQPIIEPSNYFIITPNNIYSASLNSIPNKQPYNSIFIESLHKEELQLTTPNLFTSYNQVINMFNTQIGKSFIEIRQLIRDIIHHAAIRAWANYVLDSISGTAQTLTQATANTAKEYMSKLFYDSEDKIYMAKFTIDSKTGDAVGTFTYNRVPEASEIVGGVSFLNAVRYPVTKQEGIQDMCLTNNLIIKDRNFPNKNGNIVKWENTNTTTRQYSHRIYHNFPTALFDVRVSYQNLYL